MKKPTLKQLLLAKKARKDEVTKLRREIHAIEKVIETKILK